MTATIDTRSYHGPERRHRRLFVTANSEYYTMDDICVAVRSCHTGEFFPEHHAIGRRLTGSLRLTRDGIASASPPEHPGAGEQLCFSSPDIEDVHNIVTSALERIERPSKELAAHLQG
jgi:hypothetical protein